MHWLIDRSSLLQMGNCNTLSLSEFKVEVVVVRLCLPCLDSSRCHVQLLPRAPCLPSRHQGMLAWYGHLHLDIVLALLEG